MEAKGVVIRGLGLALCCVAGLTGLAAQDLRARWALESSEAMVGQALTLSLEVQGTDQVEPPRLDIPGVEVTWLGGGPRNSQSMVSINGRTTTTVNKAFVGAWSLRAKQAGRYHVDNLSWNLNGKALRLSSLDWQVVPAQSDARFTLKQSLNQNAAVPGVEIEYRLTWYLGQSAQSPQFSLPILDTPGIELIESVAPANQAEQFQIKYRGRVLTGVKSTAQLSGTSYSTLEFRLRLKALKAGNYDLSGTLVSFEGAVATRQTQDFFGNLGTEAVYKPLVAQANPLVLQVRDLPSQGKPSPFSGLIGSLKLSWIGLKGPYQVGEPIRLGLKLEGVLNKPQLDLEGMVLQALADPHYQLAADPNPPADAPDSQGFVFRARQAGPLAIPALTLNYFDPTTGRYATASTQALSIEIKPSASAIAGPATPGTGGGAQPDKASSGQDTVGLNPPGLPGALVFPMPWWLWLLSGFLAGAPLALMGAWRHSKARRLRLARLAWQASLGPLQATDPRGRLEEARRRLHGLMDCPPDWRERLEGAGHWSSLEALAQDWDHAFFAPDREHEPWDERWHSFCDKARGWK